MTSPVWLAFTHFMQEQGFKIPEGVLFLDLGNHLLGVEKWEWDYKECLQFQLQAVEFVIRHREYQIFIFCNHPAVYTMGRGLQKAKGKVVEGLQEFTPEQLKQLHFPLHRIHRGGGLTFHHPGQWIFYPIINLQFQYKVNENENGMESWGLSRHFDWQLEASSFVVDEVFNLKTTIKRETAGLWVENNKLASVGLGVTHFVTHHGIALNLYPDWSMREDMMSLYPCGLPAATYTSIEEMIKKERNKEKGIIIEAKTETKKEYLQLFHRRFIQGIYDKVGPIFPF